MAIANARYAGQVIMRLSKIAAPAEEPTFSAPARWSTPPPPDKKIKPGFHLTWRLVAIAAVVALGALVYWWWSATWIVTTGQVTCEEWRLSSQTSGRIAEVLVQEGARVHAGQPLVVLASDDLQAQARSAEARLNAAREHLDALERQGIDPAIVQAYEAARGQRDASAAQRDRSGAAMNQARLLRDTAAADAQRAQKTFLLKAISRDEYDKAQLASQRTTDDFAMAAAEFSKSRATADAAARVATEAERSVRYQRDRLAEAVALARQDVARYQGEYDAVRARLRETTIYAPIEGVVGWVNHHVGEVVDLNDVVVSLYDPKQVWIKAWPEADDYSYLKEGRPARVSFDSVSGTYDATVALFYPVEATNSSLPLVRVPVRTASNLRDVLHPVKLYFRGNPPAGLTPDMIARVRIKRR